MGSQVVAFDGLQIELVSQDVYEFEYEGFSIFYNQDEDQWYARHEDGEADFDDLVIITDAETPMELPMDVFGMELTTEMFQKLQHLVSAEIGTNKEGE